MLREIAGGARHVAWLNPEPVRMWAAGDFGSPALRRGRRHARAPQPGAAARVRYSAFSPSEQTALPADYQLPIRPVPSSTQPPSEDPS